MSLGARQAKLSPIYDISATAMRRVGCDPATHGESSSPDGSR